jgi:hypothetical protein
LAAFLFQDVTMNAAINVALPFFRTNQNEAEIIHKKIASL